MRTRWQSVVRRARGALCALLTLAVPALADETATPPLPEWQAPEAYRVDLVMTSGKQTFVMKRFIDGERIRSEITVDDEQFILIELADAKRTSYMLMPAEKMAIKRSTAGSEPEPDAEAEAPESQIEYLGPDTLGARPAEKYRLTFAEGPMLAWFESGSGAPLRFESRIDGEPATMEWRNLEPGSQPAKLFDVPKGYTVHDMDAVLAQMGGMGGMSGMMGMARGMGVQAGEQAGAQFGAELGASLGAAFGGPMGALAGRYLGGRVGGWLGRRVAGAVLPGR